MSLLKAKAESQYTPALQQNFTVLEKKKSSEIVTDYLNDFVILRD